MLLLLLLLLLLLVSSLRIGLPQSNRSVFGPGRKEFTGRRIAQTPNGAVLLCVGQTNK
jgi:hypothetical protein